MNRKKTFTLAAILICLILGLLIAIQLKSVNASKLQSYYDQQDLADLQDKVMAIMRENEELIGENQNLAGLITSMDAELTGDNKAFQAILLEKQKAEAFAGLTDVNGSGLQVVMDSSTEVVIKASTLLLLVNEMRASKALAISINDDRIVAMTEIRDTGTSNPQIIINGNSYLASSQFVVKAIYGTSTLDNAKQLIDKMISNLDLTALSTVSINSNILIPKLSEDSLTNRVN